MSVALSPDVIFGLTGIGVFGIGLLGALSAQDRLRRILALKLCSTGAGYILVVGAWRAPPDTPDPMPHALVITGIVVMISATALALAIIRRLQTLEDAERHGASEPEPQSPAAALTPSGPRPETNNGSRADE